MPTTAIALHTHVNASVLSLNALPVLNPVGGVEMLKNHDAGRAPASALYPRSTVPVPLTRGSQVAGTEPASLLRPRYTAAYVLLPQLLGSEPATQEADKQTVHVMLCFSMIDWAMHKHLDAAHQS